MWSSVRCHLASRSVRRLSGIRYKAFIDPSGGANDSMTLAVAHREDKLVVIDKRDRAKAAVLASVGGCGVCRASEALSHQPR